jgi:excisionase family DNA binding protein
MTERLLHPIDHGFRLLGVGRSKGYQIVKQGRLHIIKLGRKSLLSDAQISELAAELLREAKSEVA